MLTQEPMHPSNDPWEAYNDVTKFGENRLTNVEFTTTTLCNMRCEHCAVGYTLQTEDPEALPIELLLQRLDEVEHLRALSITGGEPMLSKTSVNEYVLPLLKYAAERGVRTQLNSNLTLPFKRYEPILPYLDVLHISHNYGSIEDFQEIGFAHMENKPSIEQRNKLYHRMFENTRLMNDADVLVSAETMLNKRTLPHIAAIHEQVVKMGCDRHEIHPMYPSDFGSALEVASLENIRNGIHHLLDERDPNVWMLFGTLPFYPCNDNEEDLGLLKRMYNEPNLSIRNDPDGNARLNVNIFNGEIIVSDFADAPALGNVQTTTLNEAYKRWHESDAAKHVSCHCPAVECLGPNVLVKQAYYQNVDFLARSTKITK
ncbi:radical SAM/CxCxxxxC motif protein YfkAB [Texcoconibacillus texcoconensis]|uniref:Radical SAM/CxCxxxxC motif protein YfkAB n=2 Tax=Texcoconibacillus texcoconensis TaxID=1095777 RepID=A0A840QTI5_9BACI|nr:radical SAM/CxCxxxxC motif protein YfkAB [Texcoconibacillus texcoconensis]